MTSPLHRLRQRLERAWPTASLRTYLAAVVLLALLPTAAILSWQVWSGVREEQRRTEGELERAAAAFAQSVDREVASSIEALTVLSQSELFQQGRIAAMGRLLQGRPRRDWDSVFLLDAAGAVVLDTAPHASPAQAFRELHARALRERGPVVSGVTGTPGIEIALPIVQGGRVRYVLGVRTSDAVWPRLAEAAARPERAQARLYDAQGHLIAQSGNGEEPDDTYDAAERVAFAGWQASVSIAAGPIDAAHRRAIVAALSTSGLSLLLGLALAMLVARRIGSPLRQLATRGPEGVRGHVPVREIAMLRDALANARVRKDE